ncbi:MAG: transposase [Natronohydrobacter sp.]|nr:transposase [Natronohydrobacter sp.]
MSNYSRPRIPGATIFFEVVLAERPSDLLIRHIDILREAVRLTRRDHPFDILAWVVLPERMLCIWGLPEGDSDYSTRWRLIKARFSRALPMGARRPSHLRRAERGIWARRFWEHHIRGDVDLSVHLHLCRESPVLAGLVRSAQDWPYSSFTSASSGKVRGYHAPYGNTCNQIQPVTITPSVPISTEDAATRFARP